MRDWAYGVTTVVERRGDLLPRTLSSLGRAGFSSPRLFVDGATDPAGWERRFGLPVTARSPRIGAYGNWLLGIGELYLRDPHADRYAMFQDDFVTLPHLREYLDAWPDPPRGYWNLYTFRQNQRIAPSKDYVGWYPSNQLGKGAVALVFSRTAVLDLLTAQGTAAVRHMVERPLDCDRGTSGIDGGVVSALRKIGYQELVHSPSLVQHTGLRTTMGSPKFRPSPSFPGEEYDARSMIPQIPLSTNLE